MLAAGWLLEVVLGATLLGSSRSSAYQVAASTFVRGGELVEHLCALVEAEKWAFVSGVGQIGRGGCSLLGLGLLLVADLMVALSLLCDLLAFLRSCRIHRF